MGRLERKIDPAALAVALAHNPQPHRHASASYIECPKCHTRSYNLNDIEHRYCAKCGFHDDFSPFDKRSG